MDWSRCISRWALWPRAPGPEQLARGELRLTVRSPVAIEAEQPAEIADEQVAPAVSVHVVEARAGVGPLRAGIDERVSRLEPDGFLKDRVVGAVVRDRRRGVPPVSRFWGGGRGGGAPVFILAPGFGGLLGGSVGATELFPFDDSSQRTYIRSMAAFSSAWSRRELSLWTYRF